MVRPCPAHLWATQLAWSTTCSSTVRSPPPPLAAAPASASATCFIVSARSVRVSLTALRLRGEPCTGIGAERWAKGEAGQKWNCWSGGAAVSGSNTPEGVWGLGLGALDASSAPGVGTSHVCCMENVGRITSGPHSLRGPGHPDQDCRQPVVAGWGSRCVQPHRHLDALLPPPGARFKHWKHCKFEARADELAL